MLRWFKSEENDHMCNTFFSVAMKYSLDWHVQYFFFHFFQVPHFDGKVQYFLQMNFKCIAWKPVTYIVRYFLQLLPLLLPQILCHESQVHTPRISHRTQIFRGNVALVVLALSKWVVVGWEGGRQEESPAAGAGGGLGWLLGRVQRRGSPWKNGPWRVRLLLLRIPWGPASRCLFHFNPILVSAQSFTIVSPWQ